jgi:hypothetical protein
MSQKIPHDVRAEILMGNGKYQSLQADPNSTVKFTEITVASSSSPGRKHPLRLFGSGHKDQRVGSKLRFILVVKERHSQIAIRHHVWRSVTDRPLAITSAQSDPQYLAFTDSWTRTAREEPDSKQTRVKLIMNVKCFFIITFLRLTASFKKWRWSSDVFESSPIQPRTVFRFSCFRTWPIKQYICSLDRGQHGVHLLKFCDGLIFKESSFARKDGHHSVWNQPHTSSDT